jgi:hypothetical protein
MNLYIFSKGWEDEGCKGENSQSRLNLLLRISSIYWINNVLSEKVSYFSDTIHWCFFITQCNTWPHHLMIKTTSYCKVIFEIKSLFKQITKPEMAAARYALIFYHYNNIYWCTYIVPVICISGQGMQSQHMSICTMCRLQWQIEIFFLIFICNFP